MKKFLAVLLAVLALFSILTACSDSNSVTTENPAVVAEKTSIGVGETATTKNYTLTVESFNYITSDNQFIKPDDGMKFVEVVLLIENTSDSELNVSSLMCFDAYLDDVSIDMDIMGASVSKNSSMDGTIASGKKLRGAMCYQVPETWSELQIDAKLDMFAQDKEVTIVIENK